jgi:PPP family 3-phenylpropionic acid transporter
MNQQQLHFRLSSFYFVYFLMLGGIAPYFSLYLRKLGFSGVQIGTLLALMPLARVFAPTAWAWLADHQGSRRPLVRLSTAAAALACCGLLVAKSFGALFIVILLLNVFWCAALPLVEATTMGHLKGRLGDYGRIRVWGSVSFVISVVVLGQILDRTSILWLPALLVLLFSLNAAAAWALPVDRAAPHHEEHAGLRQIMRRPEVVALFIACFMMAVAHGPYNTFYSIHLVETGYSKASVGWFWALSVIAEIAVFLAMPRLLQRFTIPSIIVFSLGCAVLRFLIIGWLADNTVLMAFAQIMHAATFGAHHAAALAAIHQFFRGRTQSRGQALYTSLGFGAGGVVGGFLSGWLWETAGAGVTFSFAAGAALVAMWVVAVRMRPAALTRAAA